MIIMMKVGEQKLDKYFILYTEAIRVRHIKKRYFSDFLGTGSWALIEELTQINLDTRASN